MGLTHFVRGCVTGVLLLFRMSQRLASSPPLAASVLCCAISVAGAGEQAEGKRSFNLPRGDAATTLSQFAGVSGRQILYMMDKVRGEQTNAVTGEFSPREALERMLTGTALVARQDVATGAFVIRRVTRSDVTEAPSPSDPPPNAKTTEALQKSMKRKNPIAILGAWLALALASSPGAQGADSPDGAYQQTGTVTGRVKNIATGQYLNQARVSLKGTGRIVYTDNFGAFRLLDVPSGAAVLEVFYTDLDLAEVSIRVPAGGALEQDVDMTSVARYGRDASTLKLDPFVVSSDRETDAQAIATNEQRFAPNIKNVLATDSFGDALGSNLGEFLKFVPGLTAEYTQQDVTGISIRGIGSDKTVFTSDGSPVATANSSSSRVFNIAAIDLNNISRIDVTKVPTPSTPADTLSGSIDMISKSAFERAGAQFNYRVTLVGNSENLALKKTPHTHGDRNTFKILPAVDFDYTLPINKNFGVVITGIYSSKFNEQHLFTSEYNTSGTGIDTSISRPYLRQYTLQDGPRTYTRRSVSIKADWRVTPNSVLSLGAQHNWNYSDIGTQSWIINVGTVGTSATATGSALSFGETFTAGATGRGAVNLNGGGQSTTGGIDIANLNWRFDDGRWQVKTGFNASHSTRGRPDRGHFATLTSALNVPVRISLSGATANLANGVEVFDNDSRPVDVYNVENYRITGATRSQLDNVTIFRSANVDVRRRMDVWRNPFSVQGGAAVRAMRVDTRLESINWTYAGPDGNPATNDPATPYAMQVYRNQDSGYGFRNVPWLSVNRAWAAFQQNPTLFIKTPAQLVAEETYRISNSEKIDETVSAFYLQTEMRLLRNRLNVLTGVRFEKTTDDGEGPLYDPNAVFARNADGAFLRDTQGNRIRRPEAGAAGSMEELRQTRSERAYKARRSYEGYYPSLHLNYEVRENVLARLAYARTYGRPNFVDIIPNATINERDLDEDELNDPNIVRGTITVRNTGLRPWTADNFDLSLEYYTRSGGLLSGGLFVKEIQDFFGTEVKLATLADLERVGLDPKYVGWNLSTKLNSGDARITGAELSFRHSLRALGEWGSHFTVFANGTRLELRGNQQANFSSFIPKTANWGITFSKRKTTLSAKWHYRGLNKLTASPVYGPDAYQYYGARTILALNASYQLTPRLALAASANNVTNVPETLLRYGSETPAYARQIRTSEFGVAIALGIKGSF